MISSLLTVTLASTLLGAGGTPGDSLRAAATAADAYDGRAGDLEVATPSVPSAGISIDGRLDDPAWEQAALLHSFTQFDPIEGVPASQRTEVLVLVDADAIYFAVRAHDDEAAGIRATLSERDSYARSDDFVRFILDTYNDARRAYVFTVNPYGVQHDGIWNEGGGSAGRRGRGNFGDPIDDNPDFLWDSEAELGDWGYSVEVRIPFKTLRFPERDEQTWGLQVMRNVQRNGFKSAWAPVTQNTANRLTESGKLTGLRNLDPGLFMELNPVLTGKRIGTYDATARGLQHDDPAADFGFNATYGLTSNLTLDATYNPDFSQVEADAGQISVNERFALFFPEKRPFFLEGTEIFGMPQQLIYTRSIANPVAGAKLTGKMGSVNVGYLGAVDEPFDAGESNTVVNLMRVRKDLGAASTLGAVYTDRTTSADEFNRVAGADARFVLARRYTFTFTGAASFTSSDATSDTETGRLMHARFERAGRAFSLNAELVDTDASFAPGSGFFQRVGDTELTSRVAFNFFGRQGGLIEQFGPSVEFRSYWDHDDFWDRRGPEEAEAQIGWRLSFRSNVTFWGNYTRGQFSYSSGSYSGLFVDAPSGDPVPFRPDQALFDDLDGLTLSLWFNNWQRVRGNVRYTVSDEPIFDRGFGVAVEPATSYNGNLTLNLFPTRALIAELGLNHSRLVRKRDGVEHSSALIPRVRAQYQFNRSLFVRGIFEYSSQERRPLFDPATGHPLASCGATGCAPRAGSDGYDFHVEGLVSYEPSPGTVFYLGYTRQMEDSDAFRFRRVRALADGLFVKLSYRFRM